MTDYHTHKNKPGCRSNVQDPPQGCLYHATLLLSIFGGCIQVSATSEGVVIPQVQVNISIQPVNRQVLERVQPCIRGIRRFLTLFDTKWEWLQCQPQLLSVTEYLKYRTCSRFIDNLSSALCAEADPTLIYFVRKHFPKCPYQSRFARLIKSLAGKYSGNEVWADIRSDI